MASLTYRTLGPTQEYKENPLVPGGRQKAKEEGKGGTESQCTSAHLWGGAGSGVPWAWRPLDRFGRVDAWREPADGTRPGVVGASGAEVTLLAPRTSTVP